MKVKVPKEIKIGAHTYNIMLRPNLMLDEKDDARANHRLGFIAIDPIWERTQRDECCLHEIVEVINRVWNCQLDHDNMDRLAEGFLVFLQELGIVLDWAEIENTKG